MPDQEPTPRAPRTIIYVPGRSRSKHNTGEAVATSITAVADVRAAGRFSLSTAAPAPEGLRGCGTIVNGHSERLVDVYELDYRRTMEQLDRDENGVETKPPGVLSALFYAARAWVLWSAAWSERTSAPGGPAKSIRARAQLVVGLVLASTLILVAVLAVATLVVAAVAQISGRKLDLLPATDALLLGGLVTGAAYLAFRKALLLAAAQARTLLRYLDEPSMRQRIAVEVRHAIDDLRDEGYPGEIHLVAYSFGSSVCLDALLCHPGDESEYAGVCESVTSLVTIGCPYDVEKLFFPNRLTNLVLARTETLPWRNVFIASDLFGSNFQGRDDQKDGPSLGPSGLPVTSIRYLPEAELTAWSLVRLAAFRNHTRYWHERGGCWGQVIDLWLGVTVP